MAKKPESRLQRSIRDKLESEVGGWWFKVWGGPFQVAGVPDLVGCVCGMFFAFEVKVPGRGKLSAIQVETIRRIVDQGGGCALEVTNAEEAIDAVYDTLREVGRIPTGRGRVRPKR